MDFKILTDRLLYDYTDRVGECPFQILDKLPLKNISVDYFEFYKSVSSVYSSKIEGEDIDFDSYYKHKFLKVKFRPDYTQRADDLFAAYNFIEQHPLNLANIKKVHTILSTHLLPENQQGIIRHNPMFVINNDDEIEYVAASPEIVNQEFEKLFDDIALLIEHELNAFEIFYYASMLHLVFVKIHPFQDGNGRTARLLEKWFLIEKIGKKAIGIQLEKNYYKQIEDYYLNIRVLGLEYEELNYKQSLDFLLMTINGLKK